MKLNETKINKFLFKSARYSGYALGALMALYWISGYGMTKGIIDPIWAKSLHEKWLPLPTAIFCIIHFCAHFKFFLKKYIKDEAWLNVYILALGLVVLIVCFYLYFL